MTHLNLTHFEKLKMMVPIIKQSRTKYRQEFSEKPKKLKHKFNQIKSNSQKNKKEIDLFPNDSNLHYGISILFQFGFHRFSFMISDIDKSMIVSLIFTQFQLLTSEQKQYFQVYIDKLKLLHPFFENSFHSFSNVPQNTFEQFSSQYQFPFFNYFQSIYLSDCLYEIVSYMSENRLPPHFFPAASMQAPIYWTIKEDFEYLSYLFSMGINEVHGALKSAFKKKFFHF